MVPAIASIPGETRRKHVNWAIGLDACHRDVYWQCLKQDRIWVPSHLAEVGHLRVMGWLCCEVIQKPGFLLSYCLTVPRALFSSERSGELASRSSSGGNMAVWRANPSALRVQPESWLNLFCFHCEGQKWVRPSCKGGRNGPSQALELLLLQRKGGRACWGATSCPVEVSLHLSASAGQVPLLSAKSCVSNVPACVA